MLHAVEIDKALIDGITEVGWGFLTDDMHHPTCEFTVQLIVAAEDGDLFMRELLCYLVIRGALFDAQRLGLVGSRHDTTVIIGLFLNFDYSEYSL